MKRLELAACAHRTQRTMRSVRLSGRFPALLILTLAIGVLLAPADTLPGPATTDTRPPDDTLKPQRDVPHGLLPVMKGETQVLGTVLDRTEKPLAGIQVKLFVDGMMCREVLTDAVGQYDFKQHINFTGKETVAIWFVDPSHKLVPKALILAENTTSKEAKLLSPCFTRIMFEQTVESRVHLFDKDTRTQQVFASGCI